MAQNSFALMTNLGRAKEAAALANGNAIVITHIAIGDGTTVPSGGETALYNEVARKAISGHGTVVGAANTAYFDIFLAASDGPYTIREAGLYDNVGDLIAIARYDPPISKPVPSSGQTVEGTVRLQVAFSNIANVTIVVDPSFSVPLQRLSRLPWIPVLSTSITAPPATPALGDTYLVPTGATGSWAGQSGKIAEFTVAGWGILTPPDGHGISLPDGRVFEKVDGTYIEKIALDVQSGKWNYAVAAGTANALTVTFNPAPSSFATLRGMPIRLMVTSSNTSVATLNINGLGARPIQYRDGRSLNAGELKAGQLIEVWISNDLSVFHLASTPLSLSSSSLRDYRFNNDLQQIDVVDAGNISLVTSATVIGQVTLPAGHLNMIAEATYYAGGGTGSDTTIYLSIFMNDGSGWQNLEYQHQHKIAGKEQSIVRPVMRTLDPTKSYQIIAVGWKKALTGNATPPAGNLQVQGFKV